MNAAGKTDRGLVRETNQDAFRVGAFPGGAWAVVCDGMGGANGGGLASSIAVSEISERLAEGFRQGEDPGFIRDVLFEAAGRAHARIYGRAKEDGELIGMGTTALAAVAAGGLLHAVHAGDSRIYIVSADSGIEQVTVDHSMVQMMLNNGDLTPEEAKNHPRKHIITRAVGVGKTIELDYIERRLLPGDAAVLCTDGLTNYAEAGDIREAVLTYGPESAPEKLIQLANANGGGDNITVVTMWE